MRQLLLSSGWQLKQRAPGAALDDAFAEDAGWITATVPGNVHTDLIAAGLLPDPFDGMNERAAQWVGECDWLYRCDFELPEGFADARAVALCCDGLDTFATVWLNGQQVIVTDNMFVPQRAEVRALLRPGRNQLRVLFESALLRGREREAEHGVLACWNGEPSRLYVRKAQYHYGWDWGPTLLTAGPWRPVRLEAYDARIADVECPAEVSEDLQHARVPVAVSLEVGGDDADPTQAAQLLDALAVRIELLDPDGAAVGGALLPAAGGSAHTEIAVGAPRLWWPAGYGEQPLYRLSVSLERGGEVLDRRELRLGLRRLRLVQEPLEGEPGTTFLFEVNNTPIFCGGANWIPADSFTPRIPPERYRALLRAAVDMNMVMVRVWGGGIYEDEVFYDTCDELGLLVWQDFMFACGIYPAQPWFQESVRAEAEAQVRRLRHHACIALWCGNNEDYQIARSRGVYAGPHEPPDAGSPFPARVIYERLLPEVCARLDPTRAYWPGSPFGGDDPDDPTVGDRHAWAVWQLADYHDYPQHIGRFVSEFGMAAAPDVATVAAFARPEERHPWSRTFEHHNKAADGPRRLAAYLSDNLPLPSDLEGYVYATQLVQAEALATAYRSWRRRWGGPGRYAAAGALVWQLDDCWPVTSWAIIDYYLRKKPACYVIRRCLAPLALGLARAGDGVDVWAVNGTLREVAAQLELRTWTLTGEPVAVERASITLAPNRATELGSFGFDPGGALVIDARLRVGDEVVARQALWPEPFKYYLLPDPLIVVELDGPETVRLRSVRPAKGVLLTAGDGVEWSDNMLDLMPDDVQTVTARGLGERPVQVRWLGM
ncbi:MAG: glycoside hydrolase family 2 protein [Chloroflexota bacterium]|nr:MAG: beta-mannosidase [Chloroflexota bacterium]